MAACLWHHGVPWMDLLGMAVFVLIVGGGGAAFCYIVRSCIKIGEE